MSWLTHGTVAAMRSITVLGILLALAFVGWMVFGLASAAG